jgi:hypothetical protein
MGSFWHVAELCPAVGRFRVQGGGPRTLPCVLGDLRTPRAEHVLLERIPRLEARYETLRELGIVARCQLECTGWRRLGLCSIEPECAVARQREEATR